MHAINEWAVSRDVPHVTRYPLGGAARWTDTVSAAADARHCTWYSSPMAVRHEVMSMCGWRFDNAWRDYRPVVEIEPVRADPSVRYGKEGVATPSCILTVDATSMLKTYRVTHLMDDAHRIIG